ncbi:MAG: alpha/beta hydrolase [Photobacterium frigidiphilum]|uniref:alpha/beta hydrolase n=1 Tax=Photobacterium frigidiphilum TaxID=264736 RepID=UPI0030016807
MYRLISGFAVSLLLAGCGGGDGGSDFSKTTTDAQRTCPPNMECGFLSVPKDYSNLSDGNIDVYYGVRRANIPSQRLGILVFNFGGPGASAVNGAGSMAANRLPNDILNRFDIVGMDPRGAGRSEYAEELTQCAENGNCDNEYATFAQYVGSNSVVKDLDQLRQKFGDDYLNFIGYSYGTRLGSLYAQQFPEHVRAIVLDSSMSPNTENYLQLRLGNTKGFDTVANYRLENTSRMNQFETVVESVNASNYYSDIEGDWFSKYESDSTLNRLVSRQSYKEWDSISTELFHFLDDDDVTDLQTALYQPIPRMSKKLSSDQLRSDALFGAVICTDELSPISTNEVLRSDFMKESKLFGHYQYEQNASLCADWPNYRDSVANIENMEQKLAGQRILIIGGQYDPATPYAWTESMYQQFGNLASLITVSNYVDHGFSFDGNTCIDNPTTQYLLNPEIPVADITCDGFIQTKSATYSNGIMSEEDIHPAKRVRGF